MSQIEDKVKALVKPIVEELGYELFEVKYGKEGQEQVLDIIIDKDGANIDLDDCEKVSRAVDAIIEQADPIESGYLLAVSSPGADRELKTSGDLNDNLDKMIDIKLYKAYQGGKKHSGKLLSFDEEKITILDRTKKLTIPREIIAQIRQFVDFE